MKKKQRGIGYYVSAFKKLQCGRLRGKMSPHKAVLLMAVMEEVANATITNGFAPHNAAMVDAYMRIWKKHIGFSHDFRPNFATAFCKLALEGFWTLMKTDKWVDKPDYTLGQIRKCFFGAKISDDLWTLFVDKQSRQQLTAALLEKYILPIVQYKRSKPEPSPLLFDFNDPKCQLTL